jgi:hypothetical protein
MRVAGDVAAWTIAPLAAYAGRASQRVAVVQAGKNRRLVESQIRGCSAFFESALLLAVLTSIWVMAPTESHAKCKSPARRRNQIRSSSFC